MHSVRVVWLSGLVRRPSQTAPVLVVGQALAPHLYFIEQDKLIDWKDKGFTLVQTVDTNKRAPNLACACGMQRMLAMPSDDVSCSRIRFSPTAYDLFPVALQLVIT